MSLGVLTARIATSRYVGLHNSWEFDVKRHTSIEKDEACSIDELSDRALSSIHHVRHASTLNFQ